MNSVTNSINRGVIFRGAAGDVGLPLAARIRLKIDPDAPEGVSDTPWTIKCA